MSKTMKRVSALLLAVLMIVSFMPMMQDNAYAATKVGKPSITAKVSNQNIAFSWKASKAKKYTVTITNTVTKKVVKKFAKKATKKFTVKNGGYGVKYTIKVQAFNGKKKSKAVSKSATTKPMQLKHADWNPEVKNALNAMMAKNAQKKQYAVFDFDNTCSIFDVEEQLAMHQLNVLAFAESLTPAKLAKVLATDLGADYFYEKEDGEIIPGSGKAVTSNADYCENKNARYDDWIDDIVAAYTKLKAKEAYTAAGAFTPAGITDATVLEQLEADPDFHEFRAKMRTMYDAVFDNESADVAYPWVLYWFTGMTEKEVYDLAYASHSKYKAENTSRDQLLSGESKSTDYPETKIGEIGSYNKDGSFSAGQKFFHGTQVSENIVELMKCLSSNGIDVWVCSASATDPIRAAIDVFGLHNYVKGMLAMTNVVEGKKYINEYDYQMGYAWFPVKGKVSEEGWKRDNVPTRAQTQGKGKVTAIQNVCYPKYSNHGPIAGFMDSTGDFNFCTEFKTLQVVCCFNRADRKETDGGGVIAELAVHQADDLKMTYANRGSDTLYVLQGRDERDLRKLNPGRATYVFKQLSDEQGGLHVFGSEYGRGNNQTQYEYMRENEMSTAAVLNRFSLKKAAGAAGNPFDDFKIGFLAKYDGYHSQK